MYSCPSGNSVSILDANEYWSSLVMLTPGMESMLKVRRLVVSAKMSP